MFLEFRMILYFLLSDSECLSHPPHPPTRPSPSSMKTVAAHRRGGKTRMSACLFGTKGSLIAFFFPSLSLLFFFLFFCLHFQSLVGVPEIPTRRQYGGAALHYFVHISSRPNGGTNPERERCHVPEGPSCRRPDRFVCPQTRSGLLRTVSSASQRL